MDNTKEKTNQYIVPSYARFDAALERGEGCVAYGTEGQSYIDFGTGIGVNSLGYCDDGWTEAVIAQLKTLQHTSNLYSQPAQAELAEKLVKVSGLEKVFYCNSGAEANECAIKTARKYSFDKYGEGRNKIITLKNSFHGRTVTTLSATGQDKFHNYFFPFTEGFAYADADSFESVKALDDGTVCGVLLELVQGEGGVRALSPEFVSSVASYCAKHDLLLMVDEVQTGAGRTGTFFCYESYGILPDVVTVAKGLGGGLPIGACLFGKKTENVLTAGTHATTFGGNPVVCAGAIYIVDTISQKSFLEEVNARSVYVREKLVGINGVKEITGKGLMIGLVLESANAADVAKECLKKGLLVLTASSLLRLMPPLNIPYESLDKGIDILKNVLEGSKTI